MLNKPYSYLRMVILVFFLFILNDSLSQNARATLTSNAPQMGNVGLKPKIYALLVGINEYDNLPNLKDAEKDVRDFSLFLKEAFNEEIILDTLLSKEAKLDNILTSIGLAQDGAFGNVKKAYFLFSVHGGTSDINSKDGYLYVKNSENPRAIIGKDLLQMKYLKNLVEIFTKEDIMVILIIDACHAGSINPQKIHQTVNSWNNDKVSVKFLACQEDEKALESDSLQNGILVHYFMKGAHYEANSDNNDTIDVNEMRKYLVKNVEFDALKFKNKKQTPIIIGRDSLIIAILKKNPESIALPTKEREIVSPENNSKENRTGNDSLKVIESSFKKSLEKEDLNEAFNWLMKYKSYDSMSLPYHQLKYKYVGACYNISITLSEKLVDLTLNSFAQASNVSLFKSTDIFNKPEVANKYNVTENLKKCLNLLKTTEPYYEEINYRLLILEGYKQQNIKKINAALQINPDFAYPYLFQAYINCKNENYVNCIKHLEKFKDLTGDGKGLGEIILAVDELIKKEKSDINNTSNRKPNLYLVSVGVMNDLQFPQKDAEAIYNTFLTQEGKLFGKVIPKLLVCKDKTTRAFLGSTIANLKEENIQKQDLMILFFSGNGKTTTAFGSFDFGLLGSDFSQGINVDEYLLLSYQQDIIKHINALPCNKIILLDACRSGAANSSKNNDFSEVQKRLGNTPSSIITLTSSSINESSWENKQWQHGAFTKVLLEGLSGKADADKNTFISIEELAKYVIIGVPELVASTIGRTQTPRLIEPIEHDYPIFNYLNKNDEVKWVKDNCDINAPALTINKRIAVIGLKSNKDYDNLITQLAKEHLEQTDKEKFSFTSNTLAINIAKSGLAEKLIKGEKKSLMLPTEMSEIDEFLILKRQPSIFKAESVAGQSIWTATTSISYYWIDKTTKEITFSGELSMMGADSDKKTAEKRAIERLLQTIEIILD